MTAFRRNDATGAVDDANDHCTCLCEVVCRRRSHVAPTLDDDRLPLTCRKSGSSGEPTRTRLASNQIGNAVFLEGLGVYVVSSTILETLAQLPMRFTSRSSH